MRGRIITVIVLLICGAIVNIAVAWTLPMVLSDWRVDAWRLSMPLPSGALPPLLEVIEQHEGKTYRYKIVDPSESPTRSIMSIRALWYSVNVTRISYITMEERHLQTGWPTLSWQGALEEHHLQVEPDPGPVPLLAYPVFSGFIINTLFYAALIWLIFLAPFTARRMFRRRRGLCEKCTYPIGVSPVCTECGAPVRARADDS